MQLHQFESIDAAAAALSARIAAALSDALRLRAAASLLVPGGRTPVSLFRRLRQAPLDWQRVCVSLTDERWVSPDHPDSNARLVRAELLTEAAASARFIPLHNSAPDAATGSARSWQSLGALARPFDVVTLGMGDDGHFASLFPGSPGLATALDVATAPACVGMCAPAAPSDRISLNLAALADTRQLFLFITGAAKLQLIQLPGQRSPLPIDALLALRAPEPEIYWAP